MANGNGNSMTLVEALALVEQQKKQIAELESAKQAKITIKLAEFGSGTVSVYGIQRFPVSLYENGWNVIEAKMPEIKAFISSHKNEIRCKGYAAEFVSKLGVKWDDSKGATNEKYKTEYAKGYSAAMADASLVSSLAK